MNTCSGTRLYTTIIILIILCTLMITNQVRMHGEFLLVTTASILAITSWASFLVHPTHRKNCVPYPHIVWHIHTYTLNASVILLSIMYGKRCPDRSLLYALLAWYAIAFSMYDKAHRRKERIVGTWSWKMNKTLVRLVEAIGLLGLGFMAYRTQMSQSTLRTMSSQPYGRIPGGTRTKGPMHAYCSEYCNAHY